MRKRIFSLLTALALCLSLLPATASAADHGDHSADDGWTALSGEQENLTLSNKSYYLSDDVTYTGTGSIGVTGTVTLCLNGHVLNLNGKNIYVSSGTHLTLCDCNSTGQTHKFTVGTNGLWTWNDAATGENVQSLPGGVITGGQGYTSSGLTYGGGVYVAKNGSFTMTGGNIAGNTASGDGGGVYVTGNNSTFTMTGGTIAGNTAGFGGGVSVDNGSGFTMEGGTISGNKASGTYGGYGGGVFAYSSFTMTGGSIAGNTAGKNGGGVHVTSSGSFTLSGSPTIEDNILTDGTTASNICLRSKKTIAIDEELSNAQKIGVTIADYSDNFITGTFTSGWNTYMGGENPADYFFSENADYGVTLDESGEAKLAPQYTAAARWTSRPWWRAERPSVPPPPPPRRAIASGAGSRT